MSRTIVVVLFVLLVAAGAAYEWGERLPVMEWAVRAHASKGSRNCGTVTSSSSNDVSVAGQMAIDCVKAADQQGQPFFVVFAGTGTDEQVSQALVADGHGNAVQLFYGTGSVEKGGLFKSPCEVPLQLLVEQKSPYGFPRLHCAPWPPPRDLLSRDFLLW